MSGVTYRNKIVEHFWNGGAQRTTMLQCNQVQLPSFKHSVALTNTLILVYQIRTHAVSFQQSNLLSIQNITKHTWLLSCLLDLLECTSCSLHLEDSLVARKDYKWLPVSLCAVQVLHCKQLLIRRKKYY